MKKDVLLLIGLLLSQYLSYGEINFISSMKNALIIAEAEKKPIFIDAMASWCGPCKLMDKEVFSDDLVAAFFNENYVNVKIDADRDQRFKNKYNIQAFPTLLFLDSNGKETYKKVGYSSITELYNLGKQNIEGSVYDISEQMTKLKDIDDEELFTFFEDQIELGGAKYINLYGNNYLEQKGINNDFRAKLFVQLLPNASQKNVKNYIKSSYYKEEETLVIEKIVEAILNYSKNDLEEAQRELRRYPFENKKRLEIYLKSVFYNSSVLPFNFKNFKSEMDLVLFYPETKNIGLLNNIIAKMVLELDDPIYIEGAINSLSKQVEQNPAIHFYDGLALLYYKLGENDLAIQSVSNAINLANKTEVVFRPSLQSLKKKIKPIE